MAHHLRADPELQATERDESKENIRVGLCLLSTIIGIAVFGGIQASRVVDEIEKNGFGEMGRHFIGCAEFSFWIIAILGVFVIAAILA